MIDRHWRIVFMGTPGFAVPTLQFLMEAGYTIAGVVTAPDKLGGRGMKQVISSPIKAFAREHDIPVLQPVNLKSREFLEALRGLQADIQVVVAFRMLPQIVWNMPPHGSINLHGSLLPAYRGAAPIQWAIIRGEKITGLTTFQLQHAIDTGHILLQYEIPILEEDDASTLHDRMMTAGARLMISTIDLLQAGKIKGQPQSHQRASHAPKIEHEDARIDWTKSSTLIHNLIRGMSPYPAAWTMLDGVECKIFKAAKVATENNFPPGTITIENKRFLVRCGEDTLELKEIQLAGKRRMKMVDFLNGYSVKDWSLT